MWRVYVPDSSLNIPIQYKTDILKIATSVKHSFSSVSQRGNPSDEWMITRRRAAGWGWDLEWNTYSVLAFTAAVCWEGSYCICKGTPKMCVWEVGVAPASQHIWMYHDSCPSLPTCKFCLTVSQFTLFSCHSLHLTTHNTHLWTLCIRNNTCSCWLFRSPVVSLNSAPSRGPPLCSALCIRKKPAPRHPGRRKCWSPPLNNMATTFSNDRCSPVLLARLV